jgi:hypothetical protein
MRIGIHMSNREDLVSYSYSYWMIRQHSCTSCVSKPIVFGLVLDKQDNYRELQRHQVLGFVGRRIYLTNRRSVWASDDPIRRYTC